MTLSNTSVLQDTEAYVKAFFAEHVPDKYVFHDFEHTVQTVAAVRVIAEGFELSEGEITILQLATWFHDTGYAQGPESHEERSTNQAEAFLQGKISDKELESVLGCIRATKVPQQPSNLLEQIICDADLDYLGRNDFSKIGNTLFRELNAYHLINDEQAWNRLQVSFLSAHSFHTHTNRVLREPIKQRYLEKLKALVATYEV